MQLIHLTHTTHYQFDQPVKLGTHRFYLRPRDGFDLRIRSSQLQVDPKAAIVWRRDAFGNSVAEASFKGETEWLTITSEAVLEQYFQQGPQLPQCKSESFAATDAALRPFLSNFLDVEDVAPSSAPSRGLPSRVAARLASTLSLLPASLAQHGCRKVVVLLHEYAGVAQPN